MVQRTEKSVQKGGPWESPITADLVATNSISLHEVRVNESKGAIYWVESRPKEGGRYTIMESTASGKREVLPQNHSAWSRVQELGGGTLEIGKRGHIIFSDNLDSCVYKLDPESMTTSLVVKAEAETCYADFSLHDDWILAVKEDAREATPETQAYGVHNTLVAFNTSGGATQTELLLAEGDDFYSYPRFSPDGARVCWIQHSHPDMPWTGSVLWVADWQGGKLTNRKSVAGQPLDESVSQPRWSPDGKLFFTSDRTGYWQLYTHSFESNNSVPVPVAGFEHSEFAIADWRLASSTYIFLDAQTIVASCVTLATSDIILIDLKAGTSKSLNLPYVDLARSGTGLFRVSNDSFAVLGSTLISPKQVALISSVRAKPEASVLKSTLVFDTDTAVFSKAQHIEIPRTFREGRVYAFYYPPQHTTLTQSPGVAPPGLMYVHGGPNGVSTPALDLSIQFWTSRGYAVVALNYTGSVGFGREYREDLTGNWGLYDVQDTFDCAEYLKQHGLVSNIGIYGGSAGGYLSLCAIHMFPNSFAAAVSSYGISDIKALQADTYKFESHDVERLALSSCKDEDRASRYEERSPLYHAQKITAPLLILQGSIDKVVPCEQAYMMAEKMRQNNRVCKVVEFEGEAHGWLKEDSILRAYREQEAWWAKYLWKATE